MEKKIEFVMELFDMKVRRLRNGNKIALVFENQEDLELEKKLIEFRGEDVQAIITQEVEPEKKKDIITIESEFEVFDLKCRRLRNGDKLQLTLEQAYKKDNEINIVKLRFQNCKIFLKSIVQELDLNDDEEEEREII